VVNCGKSIFPKGLSHVIQTRALDVSILMQISGGQNKPPDCRQDGHDEAQYAEGDRRPALL